MEEGMPLKRVKAILASTTDGSWPSNSTVPSEETCRACGGRCRQVPLASIYEISHHVQYLTTHSPSLTDGETVPCLCEWMQKQRTLFLRHACPVLKASVLENPAFSPCFF